MPVTRRSSARLLKKPVQHVYTLEANDETAMEKDDDNVSFNSAIYDGPKLRNRKKTFSYEETETKYDNSSPLNKKSAIADFKIKSRCNNSLVVKLDKINLPLHSIENEMVLTPRKSQRLVKKTPKKHQYHESDEHSSPKKNKVETPTKNLCRNFDVAVSLGNSYRNSQKKRDLQYQPTFSSSSDEEESDSGDETSSSYEAEEEEDSPPKRCIKSVATPKKTPARKSDFTPSMLSRRSKILKPGTPLQQARIKLHVSAVPSSLPCRGEEFNTIFNFLHGRLSDGAGGCIYVSGVPGTGKTATVNEAIKCLNACVKNGKLKEFDYVDINGMRLSEPRQAYVQIYKQLTGENKLWEESQNLLQKRFTKKTLNKKMTLILVDELDMLCNRRQDVIYNLLDWPSHSGAKLLVITIANTMDLPERCLMGRVTSRMGLTRLTFKPYTFKELEQIVNSRLEKIDGVFRNDAIQFVSRKVAAVSGDARRALDICRRSTEVAEKNDRDCVTLPDVNEALTEMIANVKVQAIKHCSLMEQLFLKAIVSEVTRIGIEEVIFRNVFRSLQDHTSFEGLRVPNVSEALAICSRLSSWRLIICDHSKMDLNQRIVLNVSADDVHYATIVVDKD